MFLLNLLLALCILCSARIGLADVGGEDVQVKFEASSDPLADAPGATLAFDSEGIAFSAVETTYPGAPVVYVHRSTDGGTSWEVWGTLGSATLGETAEAPSITVLPQPSGDPTATELLAVATVYFDPAGGGAQLRVSVADPAQPTATWTHYVAVPGTAVRSPRVVGRLDQSGDRHFYVTYVDFLSNPGGNEIRLVTKFGSGAFSAPVTVFTGGASATLSHDIATEAGDTIHVSCAEYDDIIDTGWLYYARSQDDGATWSTPLQLMTLPSPFAPLTSVAASPVSEEVAVVADLTVGAVPAVAVNYSPDHGSTWFGKPNLAGRRSPVLAWSAAGCAMATVTQPAWENGSFLLAEPGLTTWSADPMLKVGVVAELPALVPSPVALAADPTHEDRFAMTGLMDDTCGSETVQIWFDAQWRTGVGYPLLEYRTDPFAMGSLVLSTPVVGDVDNNGIDDVIFAQRNHLMRWHSGSLDTIRTVASSYLNSPALGDIDEDGDLEIFTGDPWLGWVRGNDHEGAQLPGWPVIVAPAAEVHVSLREWNGVTTHIVAGAGNQVWAFDPDGNLLAGFPFTAPAARGDLVGRVAIGDIEGGGGTELVLALEGGVIALDLAGNVVETVFTGTSVAAAVSMSDVDGDGDLEIVFPLIDGTVELRHHDGINYGPGWPVDIGTGQPIQRQAIIADSDVDDVREIHILDSARAIVVELDGTLVAGWPQSADELLSETDALVQNVGQPGLQMLASGHYGSTYAWSGPTGERLPGYPYDPCQENAVTLATGNVDEDGAGEIVVLSDTRLRILDTQVPLGASARTWPMSGYDAARSSCAGCAPPVVSVDASPTLGMAAVMGAPRPNPSATGSAVRLQLDASSRARVEIFDAAGRRVRTVRDGMLEAGMHEVRWDGADTSGHRAAPGVYFMRLTVGEGTGAHVTSRKLTVVR